MPRDIQQLSTDLQALLEKQGLLNLQAQAHARTLLYQLDTPPEEWPQFTPSLDERLLYNAHFMLVRGMEFFDSENNTELGRYLLLRAGESLEFIANIPQTRLSQHNERLNAAIAYHVAGYHARSYVMARRLEELENTHVVTDSLAPAILALLRRDLRSLSDYCIQVLVSEEFNDATLATKLQAGKFDDDKAVATLGRRSLTEALLLYLEFAKRGTIRFLDDAMSLSRNVASLGMQAGHVDLWWLGLAIEKLLRDLGDSSLWQGLRDLSPISQYNSAINLYIEAGFRASPSTITLWPSQRTALDMIKAAESPSFCIRMPTSAGKTKIAEFCIIRTMLESSIDTEAKCLYIAPFRSLAVEVESTLSKGLRPLGIRVSEIYGGFDLTATDERLIQDTQVLVATPEKFDATIRLAPDLLENVRLVIIDEGHIAGDLSDRGIRAEFLINRLLWRLGRKTCRHLFISAVLPNPKEFASWIGGNEDKVVESEWRPSRLVIGECQWSPDHGRIRLSYTHEGSTPLEQEVFVQPFVRVQQVKGIPGCGRRRNPFPQDATEAYAACAIRFASLGTTLAFIPQARHVDSTARTIAKSMQLLRALAKNVGESWSFPIPDVTSPLMLEALEIISDELGMQSEIETFLRCGIAIHRGSLPGRVKVAIERLIRSGEIRLIVATTTLGQGVNLPIRTVLVRGLQQGNKKKVDAMTFWNIAGRAGRAMHENEGQVLFFNDIDREHGVIRRQRKAMTEIIDGSAIQEVIGLLHRILNLLSLRWQLDAPDVNFTELCLKLAEDDFGWVTESKRTNLKEIFELVDQHLLAVTVEGDLGPEDHDALQEILRESLLFAQLKMHPIVGIDSAAAQEVLTARIQCVFRRVPQTAKRIQFYQMGLSLKDCETIDAAKVELLILIQKTSLWTELNCEERLDLLQSFALFATRVDATNQAARSLPSNVFEIIRAWLAGKRCVEMIEAGLGDSLDRDPGKLCRFLEEYCVYGLSWVINGLISFARKELEARGDDIPLVTEHIPAMFKVGVHDPLAAVFAPYLQMDRILSVRLASLSPFGITDIDRAIAWLHGISSNELDGLGVLAEEADSIMKKRQKLPAFDFFNFTDGSISWTIHTESDSGVNMQSGDPIIISPRPDLSVAHYDVLNLKGRKIGTYKHRKGELPSWMTNPVNVVASVEELEQFDDRSVRITLRARELAE